MRKVRLLCAVKMDDPPIVGDENAILTLPTPIAGYAVRQHLAVFHGNEELDPEQPGPTRAELEAEEARIGTLKRVDDGRTYSDWNDPGPEPDGQPVPEMAGAPDAPEEAARPKRPYGNAPKSAWARYAADMSGIDDYPVITVERAELQTKADLMSRYGARLGEED